MAPDGGYGISQRSHSGIFDLIPSLDFPQIGSDKESFSVPATPLTEKACPPKQRIDDGAEFAIGDVMNQENELRSIMANDLQEIIKRIALLEVVLSEEICVNTSAIPPLPSLFKRYS